MDELIEIRVERIVSIWMRIRERLFEENQRLQENRPVEMIYCRTEKRHREKR